MATSISKLLIRLQKFSSKISKVVDATSDFNKGGFYIQDLSGWDSAVVQFGTIAGEGTITFYTTNDDGSVSAGQLLPAPEVPDNFTPVKGVDLATKGDVLVASNDSMVEFGIIGKYLSLSGDSITYPLSYAYVLSKNTYTGAQEAYDLGVLQGTQIVYTTSSTLSNSNILYSTSSLTQPIYGDGTSWYGIALLTNDSVKYAITIDGEAVIVVD
jgi:hypothetical protein